MYWFYIYLKMSCVNSVALLTPKNTAKICIYLFVCLYSFFEKYSPSIDWPNFLFYWGFFYNEADFLVLGWSGCFTVFENPA